MREKVGKKGVVRDKKVHLEVIETVIKYALGLGFHILGLDYSPIRGPEGNIEYLLYMKKENGEPAAATEKTKEEIMALVECAHEALQPGKVVK